MVAKLKNLVLLILITLMETVLMWLETPVAMRRGLHAKDHVEAGRFANPEVRCRVNVVRHKPVIK
jgi:hypothetical protein